MEQVFFKGQPYTGSAAFINGSNGYTCSEDHGLLCALILPEGPFEHVRSCWDKNGKPNCLTTKTGEKIENRGETGIIIEFKDGFEVSRFRQRMNESLKEKAVSKAQQRFFGMVRARQKGELSADEVSKSVNKAAKNMSKKDVKDFAKTKHKGLPNHVDESVNKEMEEKIRKTVREMLKSGELPKDECVEMAEYYNNILDKAIGKNFDEVPNGDENCCCSIVDDEFRKQGGKQDLDGVKNHEDSVKKGLSKVIKENTLRKIIREALNKIYSTQGGMSDNYDIKIFKLFVRQNPELPNLPLGTPSSQENQEKNAEVLNQYKDISYKIYNSLPEESTRESYHWLTNAYAYLKRGDIQNANYSYTQSIRLLVDALSKNNINENIDEISHDTVDSAYMKAMSDTNRYGYDDPMGVRRRAQAANIKKMRDERLGFDPVAMTAKMRQNGTSGDPSVDRRWSTWQRNHNDRVAGNRVYDKERGRWITKQLEEKINESVHTELIKTLGKYTNGKATSEQANKAIMNLANSSNGKVNEDRNNRSFPEYAEEYYHKNGKKLPDDTLRNAAEKNDERFHETNKVDGKYHYVSPNRNSKFGGKNTPWKDNLSESLEDEMKVWEERSKSEFGQILKQLQSIAEDCLIDAGDAMSSIRTVYALDGNEAVTVKRVKHYLSEYDIILLDDNGNVDIEGSNSPEAAELVYKLSNLAPNGLNESKADDYHPTHFAVNKTTKKIVNSWDYRWVKDKEQLRLFKDDYFYSDLRDNDLDPKQYAILNKASCLRRGINPDDNSNWANA